MMTDTRFISGACKSLEFEGIGIGVNGRAATGRGIVNSNAFYRSKSALTDRTFCRYPGWLATPLKSVKVGCAHKRPMTCGKCEVRRDRWARNDWWLSMHNSHTSGHGCNSSDTSVVAGDSGQSVGSPPVAVDATSAETAYLLGTSANARRLLEAVAQLNGGQGTERRLFASAVDLG